MGNYSLTAKECGWLRAWNSRLSVNQRLMAQEKREGFEGEETRSVNNRLLRIHDIRVDTIHIFFSLFLGTSS